MNQRPAGPEIHVDVLVPSAVRANGRRLKRHRGMLGMEPSVHGFRPQMGGVDIRERQRYASIFGADFELASIPSIPGQFDV